MIVDASALLGIILGESDREALASAIIRAPRAMMSAISYVEVAQKTDRLYSGIDPILDALIGELGIEIMAFTEQQGRLAREAATIWGKGRHAAGLNFGDCLTYALAKETCASILCKGNDFARTDLDLVTY